MLKIKDKTVTINGDPTEVLVEFALLSRGMVMGLGYTQVLMAFVQGLNKVSEENDDDEEEETNDTV